MSGEFSGGGIINNSVVQTGEGNAMQNVTTGRNARVNIVMSQPQTPSAAIRNLREVLTEHYGQVDSAAVRAELDNLGKELRAGESSTPIRANGAEFWRGCARSSSRWPRS